jgi:hypothetical protein
VVVAQSSSGEILTLQILLSGTRNALARTYECTTAERERDESIKKSGERGELKKKNEKSRESSFLYEQVSISSPPRAAC